MEKIEGYRFPFWTCLQDTCIDPSKLFRNVLKRLFERESTSRPDQDHVWPALRISRANLSLYLSSIPEGGREMIRRNAVPAPLACTSHLNSLLSSYPLQDQKDTILDLSSY